jgi:CheY-like chemotaxis protein
VRTARRSADCLLAIINDILDFSKLEAGKMALESIDCDLHRVIEEIVELLGESAFRKGLELIYSVDPAVPAVLRGDPSRLRQILLNLVGNAIKFTDRGEVIIEFSLADHAVRRATCDDAPRASNLELPHADVWLHINVRDTGIGIPAERQAVLFQAFTQADSSTTRKFGGSGLGLAICQELVHLMKGQIGVTSTPGVGSTFWCTLCLATPSSDTVRSSLPAGRFDQNAVLIMEPNRSLAQVLRIQLEACGAVVTCVDQVQSALAALRWGRDAMRPYSVLLVDLAAPGPDTDALDVLQQLHAADGATAVVPLISLGQRRLADRFRQHGAATCLIKPLRLTQLRACLGDVLGWDPRPDADSISRETPPPAPSPPSKNTGQRAYVPASILVAEDNPVNQKVARGMLERLGCTVDLVGNGCEALDAWSRKTYDLVFMDCQMPEMDGFQATREIRSRETTMVRRSTFDVPGFLNSSGQNLAPRASHPDRRIPIIAMTANAMDGDRQRCLEAGMDGYMSKPISAEALEAILRQWLPNTAVKAFEVRGATCEVPTSNLEHPPVTRHASPVTASRAVFDHKAALVHVEGDQMLLAELAGIFLRHASDMVNSIRAAIDKDDLSALEHAAHSLKGSAANLCAGGVAEAAQQLEYIGREGTIDQAGSALQELLRQLAALVPALAELNEEERRCAS